MDSEQDFLIKDYGNDSLAFRKNAVDWLKAKMREGRVQMLLNKPAGVKMFFVTPGLCHLQEQFDIPRGYEENKYYLFYQIEIKNVKNKGMGRFCLTCHQDRYMPPALRKYYIDTLLPAMDKEYGEDRQWYDMSFNSLNHNSETTNREIVKRLEDSLNRAERFEARLGL